MNTVAELHRSAELCEPRVFASDRPNRLGRAKRAAHFLDHSTLKPNRIGRHTEICFNLRVDDVDLAVELSRAGQSQG